jgi:hypothetical protein
MREKSAQLHSLNVELDRIPSEKLTQHLVFWAQLIENTQDHEKSPALTIRIILDPIRCKISRLFIKMFQALKERLDRLQLNWKIAAKATLLKLS